MNMYVCACSQVYTQKQKHPTCQTACQAKKINLNLLCFISLDHIVAYMDTNTLFTFI